MIKEYVQKKLPGGKELLWAQYQLGLIVGATVMYGNFVVFGFTGGMIVERIPSLRYIELLMLFLTCGFLWVIMLVLGTIGYYQQINKADNIYMKENSTSNATVLKKIP